MLSPIPTATLAAVKQLADKMEKILLVSLEHYGNTFVEPKVELGARFGHLVCKCSRFTRSPPRSLSSIAFQCVSWIFTRLHKP